MLRTVSLHPRVGVMKQYSLASNNHWASLLRRRPLHTVRDRRLKADGLVDDGLQELEADELVRVDVRIVSSTFARGCVDLFPETTKVVGMLNEIKDHVRKCRASRVGTSNDSETSFRSERCCIHRRVGISAFFFPQLNASIRE
jgi:hypothetical protein